MKWRDRIKEFKRVRADQVINVPWNFRAHPESQQGVLRDSIEELGFFDALDVFEPEPGVYMLIDGEARSTLINVEVGPDTMIPVSVTDFTVEEAKKALAIKDAIAGMAETDGAALSELLEGMEADGMWLRDLLDGLGKAAVAAGEDDLAATDGEDAEEDETIIPEMEAQPFEHYDYVMLMFRTTTDFQRACEVLDIKEVQVKYPGGHRKIGLGRVIDGTKAIDKLQKGR